MNVESIVYDLFGEITRLRERIHEYTGHWKQNSKSRRAAKQVYPIGVKQYNLVVMGLCTSW
ncbi:hypothetical protein N9F09_01600 [Schleiferiaceae bacterium]|nr:hypothetical protein [Schleiferiaceae bacterium]MDB0057574.1 hypothetical protein [Schleiferiaceae bacterium]